MEEAVYSEVKYLCNPVNKIQKVISPGFLETLIKYCTV